LTDRTKIIAIYDDSAFSAPIEYTFGLFFSPYGVNYTVIPLNEFNPEQYDHDEILAVSYGKEYFDTGCGKQIHIYASDFFGHDYLKPPSMPRMPLERYHDLPVIYAGQGKIDDFVKETENGVETNIDIIASSFFMVSRYEEVIINSRDEHARFPATASLAYQEGFLDRPIVNEYIELLWNWIQLLKSDLKRRPLWPQDKDFAVCLTHDVDSIRKYRFLPPVITIVSLVLRRNFKQAISRTLEYLSSILNLRKDPFDTFDYMLNLEQKYGFRSSFYFLGSPGVKFAGRYAIDSTVVKRLIHEIEESGCEVGLHGNYESFDDFQNMTEAKQKLDAVVKDRSYGCRQHFLRWKTPDTWRIQEAAGLLYDTTMTFADCTGFRCGFCLPFRPFDLLENRVMDIWELPLIVMEGSLQNAQYQGLEPHKALDAIIKLINTIKSYGGVFTVLWHNSSLDSQGEWTGWQEVYEQMLEYISSQDAWVTGGREIVKRWGNER